MILRIVLRAFGKLQRPLAWVALVYGVTTLIGTAAFLIAKHEPHFTAIGVASLVFLEGLGAVRDAEKDRGEIIYIARCPEHGLHGQRDECFVCGGPVDQVPMIESKPAKSHVA